MNNEYYEKEIRRNPLAMLNLLFNETVMGSTLEDEAFYEIVRLRSFLTPKVLKSEETYHLIQKVFDSPYAYEYVRALYEYELLEKVFPGIYNLLNVDGGHYHNETVYTHVMGALRALRKVHAPWFVKLAALYHDCGKFTWEISDAGKRRFTNHAQLGEKIVRKDLAALKIPNEIIEVVATLVKLHMSQIDGPHSIRKLARALDEKNIPHKYFFWVRYADNKGSMVHKTDFMYYWGLYRKFKTGLIVKKEPSVADLCINGHDLMREFNKGPGKWLGQVLTYLFVCVRERGYANEREPLLKLAHDFMKWYTND